MTASSVQSVTSTLCATGNAEQVVDASGLKGQTQLLT